MNKLWCMLFLIPILYGCKQQAFTARKYMNGKYLSTSHHRHIPESKPNLASIAKKNNKSDLLVCNNSSKNKRAVHPKEYKAPNTSLFQTNRKYSAKRHQVHISSKDTIILRNGNVVLGIVLSITDNEIEWMIDEATETKLYYPIKEVRTISYGSGLIHVFGEPENQKKETETATTTAFAATKSPNTKSKENHHKIALVGFVAFSIFSVILVIAAPFEGLLLIIVSLLSLLALTLLDESNLIYKIINIIGICLFVIFVGATVIFLLGLLLLLLLFI